MAVTRFNTTPTQHYKSVVAQIENLPSIDRNPAFAEAHAEPLKAAFAKWLGRQVKGVKSWKRLFGNSPKSDEGLPGDDHVELWLSDEGMRYVSHPYDLDFDTVREMVRVADENGLEFSLSGTSWYYPGRTLSVIWRPRRRQ